MGGRNGDRNYVSEFFASVVWEAIKGLFGAAIIGAAAWVFTKGQTTLPSLIQHHSIDFAISLAVLGLLVLFRVYLAYKYQDAMPRLQYDYEEISRSISLEYHDISHLTYTKEIELRALRQGMSSYIDKFRWTGKSIPIIRSDIRGQTFRFTRQKSVYQFYEISFDRTLNRGESITTRLIFDVQDPDHSFRPFISTTIEEPTRHLTLTLKVPAELGITRVSCEVSGCIGAKVPFHTQTIQVDADGYAKWDETPKINHYYEMEWLMPSVETHDQVFSGARAKSN